MGEKCRRDCAYYSTYTETCDFTLINYRVRPCPRDNCTQFRPRVEPRSWQIFTGRRRREERFELAGCGHEVYAGSAIYSCEDGKSLCGECVRERIAALGADEAAELLGFEHRREVE